MRCEVVAVGTELLLGQIVDTNSAWIGSQLALAGIDSHFQTKVGDNLGRIVACLRQALERSDAVITCGGLGPTQDDITREAIAEVMGVPLVRSPELVDKIRAIRSDFDFSFVIRQRGLFSYSGLTREQVRRLREEYSLYAIDSGRICVPALNSRNIDYVARAIASVLV